MPKLGMEPIRRDALVKATISEIGRAGSLDVTVAQIARRAGMSSGLAHHYFGGKDQIFIAAMRHILGIYGAQVRGALAVAKGPRARLEAIIRASFEAGNFRSEVISAWMNFYVQAQTSDGAKRLLHVYQARLRSNLMHDLRPLVGASAPMLADNIAALIDGLYIRHALRGAEPDGKAASERVLDYLETMLSEGKKT
ncbi:choline-binding transcriptional repressor BetI [Profundibacter amoris]|uniref:HTH-type transcriptional regulator BetI n=1 Tax=Profundibacter amoris TaxID=2171755 RepID=A0A347UHW1_9RHOB|nr:transcriptional regulator BetI [Profundibacter amoris]AXX98439.1 transcriptional regulator BetI [Profundibacter amoris]